MIFDRFPKTKINLCQPNKKTGLFSTRDFPYQIAPCFKALVVLLNKIYNQFLIAWKQQLWHPLVCFNKHTITFCLCMTFKVGYHTIWIHLKFWTYLYLSVGWSTALTTCCAKVRFIVLLELIKSYGGDGDSYGIPIQVK